VPPVAGRFENGVGLFYADEVLEGRAIKVRFTWSHITADSARWEQAFSPDGGATWEANWVAEFSRRTSGPADWVAGQVGDDGPVVERAGAGGLDREGERSAGVLVGAGDGVPQAGPLDLQVDGAALRYRAGLPGSGHGVGKQGQSRWSFAAATAGGGWVL
jgi:hypothetical protein